jgi:hypothetical protein
VVPSVVTVLKNSDSGTNGTPSSLSRAASAAYE